ncbi:MAG TPA: hypothetical protein VHS28_01475, partial [Chloroflexota bacterium]|nr:hypothetical protein [Chloroflexota bacterium]
MLDTVKVRSEPISEGLATAIERQMMRTQRTDLATGEVLYELTGAQLSGTYDHRISCRVERTELGVDPIRSAGKRAPMVERLHCRPYVVVEGSVHKALLGHNVWGGPVDLVAPVRWLVADVGRRLHVELPDGAGWRLQRVDWAEVYDLGCYEACEEYLAGFAAAAFPRREVARSGAHSV